VNASMQLDDHGSRRILLLLEPFFVSSMKLFLLLMALALASCSHIASKGTGVCVTNAIVAYYLDNQNKILFVEYVAGAPRRDISVSNAPLPPLNNLQAVSPLKKAPFKVGTTSAVRAAYARFDSGPLNPTLIVVEDLPEPERLIKKTIPNFGGDVCPTSCSCLFCGNNRPCCCKC
jgi:hypothetical protein